MATKKTQSEDPEQAVSPDVVEGIVERAEEEGISPEAAKEIVDDAVSEGVAPDKLKEVAEEAIRVEREDQEESGQ